MENRRIKFLGRKVPNPSFRIFLFIPVIIALAAVAWYGSRPMLEALKTKDAHRYQLMINEASRLHFVNAWKRWVELKNVSPDQVVRDRYYRLINQWKSDSGFRLGKNKAEVEARTLNRHRRSSEDKRFLSDIRGGTSGQKLNRTQWENFSVWQKGLLLREQCVRWLRQEIEDHKSRRNLNSSSRLEILFPASPSEKCGDWVPLRGGEQAVPLAIQALKEGMNYYYFIRLMDEIGLAENEDFSGKLNRMTNDFGGV